MGLRIYNTRTRRVEEFRPLYGSRVFMFVCGPTVYDYSHIGHARTYLFYDVLARLLRWMGYSLLYIMNITDVDDKIINRARERGVDPLEHAREYERYFYEDMESLNITSISYYARASDYIPEIIEQIKVLLEKGYAYITETGIYYDITRFPRYGQLSGRRPEELRVHRIEPDPTKRNPGDFALWKFRSREEKPGWETPWGYGRPGWHIEDTAITLKHFGKQYDIHGGAIELIFPHHEAEVAQAEAYTDTTPFVKYWVHTGLLLVDGVKMSKSLGNIITIREVLEKHHPDTLRLALLSTHYRGPIDFKWEMLDTAAASYERIKMAIQGAARLGEGRGGEQLAKTAEESWKRFTQALLNDVSTPQAIAELNKLARATNKYLNENTEASPQAKKTITTTLRNMASLLGLRIAEEAAAEPIKAEQLITLVLDIREELRRQKQYSLADEIREKLREIGVEVIDTPRGPRWRIKSATQR